MVGAPLHVEQPALRRRRRGAGRRGPTSAALEASRPALGVVEHRLPGEEPAQADAVEPADERVVRPRPRPSARRPGRGARGRPGRCRRRSSRAAGAGRRTGRAPRRRRCRPGSRSAAASCAASGAPAGRPAAGRRARPGDHQPISPGCTGIGKTPLRVRGERQVEVDVVRHRHQVVVRPALGRSEGPGVGAPGTRRHASPASSPRRHPPSLAPPAPPRRSG